MSVTIPDEIVKASGMTAEEFMLEVVVVLFQQERISMGKAAELAHMNRLDFQKLLSSRQIPIHYGVEELEQDVATLRELGLL